MRTFLNGQLTAHMFAINNLKKKIKTKINHLRKKIAFPKCISTHSIEIEITTALYGYK